MSATPADALPALLWRTRESSRHLLHAFVVSFAIAAASGVLLWARAGHDNLAQVLLLAHLAAGALALLFFLPYAVIHWRDGREPLLHLVFPFRLLPEWRRDALARRRLIGHGLLWLMAAVLFSGLVVAAPALAYLAGYPTAMLPYGGHRTLLLIHVWATPVLAAALLFHLPLKDRP